jgi:hypothetical protein
MVRRCFCFHNMAELKVLHLAIAIGVWFDLGPVAMGVVDGMVVSL